jgi:magnesium-transporting ATPase (P-type)
VRTRRLCCSTNRPPAAVVRVPRRPTDCLINDGRLEVDQSALTGESLPVTMYRGDSCKMGSTAVRGEVEATVEVRRGSDCCPMCVLEGDRERAAGAAGVAACSGSSRCVRVRVRVCTATAGPDTRTHAARIPHPNTVHGQEHLLRQDGHDAAVCGRPGSPAEDPHVHRVRWVCVCARDACV